MTHWFSVLAIPCSSSITYGPDRKGDALGLVRWRVPTVAQYEQQMRPAQAGAERSRL